MRVPGSGVSGTLYLEIEEIYFPTYDWRDMTASVLGTWIQNAMSVVHASREVMHTFMDGSYIFGLQTDGVTGTTTLTLYEEPGSASAKFYINFSRYMASLRGAGKIVLHQASALSLQDRNDLRDLGTWLQQLIIFERDFKLLMHTRDS